MVIDWMLFWTGLTALVALVTLIVGIFSWVMNRMRKADWELIRGMKADSDQKIESLKIMQQETTLKLTGVYTDLQAKLDKRDHELALDRIDKEIGELRADAKTSQSEIRQDIKDLRQDLLSAIRDALARK